MKTEVPVLSTILDYGGKESIDNILYLDPDDKSNLIENDFEKILNKSQEAIDGEQVKKKNLSFLEYKASPQKHKN